MGRRRSPLVRAVLVLGLAAPLVLSSGSPALAACPPLGFPDADGRIGLPGGNFIGINVYNLTGAGQTVTINGVPPGASGEFVVKYRNRSDKARGISVKGQVPNAVSFRIKYFLGDDNITTEMSAVNGVKFPGILPGKSTPALTVRIKVRNNAQNNDDIHVFQQGSYGNDPSCGDTLFAGVVAFS